MLESVKTYLLIIVSALCAVLFLFLKRSSNKVVTLQADNETLQIDKDLAKVKEISDATEKDYVLNKSVYDQLKSKLLNSTKK